MLDAIILANGAYDSPNGKVAHGLIRGGERFRIHAVVDPQCDGRDAGELLDGQARNIPAVGSVARAVATAEQAPEWAIVGVAPHGGRFTPELHAAAREALAAGMHLVSGLHDWAGDDPELAATAREAGVEIHDLRRPPPVRDLHFWTGAIRRVRAPRVAVLGMDCAIGKRTTTRLLTLGLHDRGHTSEMIYTGQTGWLQGGRYGFVLDATPNDYVSGELEQAIVRCDEEIAPDVILLEGQSGLRNPSGPCGAEFLLSGGADTVVLQTDPQREYFDGMEADGYRLPPVADEIALIRAYGAETVAVTLRGDPTDPVVAATRKELEAELDLPVCCPLHQDLAPVLDAVESRLKKKAAG